MIEHISLMQIQIYTTYKTTKRRGGQANKHLEHYECPLAKNLSRAHIHTLFFSILDYNTFRIQRKTNFKPTVVVYLTQNFLGMMELPKHKFALLSDN